MKFRLPRAPRTDDELWWVIKALWGVTLPRKSVCPNHCSPFDAVAHAYFGREPNFAVWYASRGSGKSLALAVLGLTKAFVADADCTILGGSQWQSAGVRDHMRKMLSYKNAPTYAVKRDIETVIETITGKSIKPLPASQTSVRGPHPPLQLLDEIDEMDYKLYQAALGQAMEQLNTRGEVIGEYIVASSTWQNPIGTFTQVMEDARKEGLPIFSWCWRDLLKTKENPYGWMSKRFIENKKRHISAEMWRTEYDLNEPSAASRAIDLDAVEAYFVEYPKPIECDAEENSRDQYWVWERYDETGTYAAGADWAKETDYTVIAVMRTDVVPRRLVALRRMNRTKYPIMANAFSRWVTEYHAAAQHDKTGVGNALNDYLDDDAAHGFVMVGRARAQMFTNYISDFEHGGYRLPRNVGLFYRSHRGATTADVFAPHKWNEHTPDDLVAMGMAHRAAGKVPLPGDGDLVGVRRDDDQLRRVDSGFATQPDGMRTEGVVSIIDERYEGDLAGAMLIDRDTSDVHTWV